MQTHTQRQARAGEMERHTSKPLTVNDVCQETDVDHCHAPLHCLAMLLASRTDSEEGDSQRKGGSEGRRE